MKGAGGIDTEVGEGFFGSPVVRGLRGGVNDEVDVAAVFLEDGGDVFEVADVDRFVDESSGRGPSALR